VKVYTCRLTDASGIKSRTSGEFTVLSLHGIRWVMIFLQKMQALTVFLHIVAMLALNLYV
jgi:hypothetical protein